ncbi:MAG: DSD1 family PLP-dependent enzyme [Negativicutes bacterium]|nr:DSD1 family PLP-dependent enzyme [Negativicutes bacterium]
MQIDGIETPALILDQQKFEQNLQTMMDLIKDSGMALRPHYKSHKSTAIALKQIEYGAKGITCAKLGEAEDLAEAGVQDILIANQIVQPAKLSRVAWLARRCRLTLCVDCEENILALAAAATFANATVHCYVEFDVGMKRCGVTTFAAVEELARCIMAQPHLSFDGIQAYAGQLSHEYNTQKRTSASALTDQTLVELKKYLEERGIPVAQISGGSTGTALLKGKPRIYTELQAGTYIFMDASYGKMQLPFEQALFVLTTVISSGEHWVVTDAGVKSVGVDQGNPVFVGFDPAAPVNMSEEHGAICLEINNCKINDKIFYIPGHSCTTANLHDKIYLVHGDQVVDRFLITSRGKAQ